MRNSFNFYEPIIHMKPQLAFWMNQIHWYFFNLTEVQVQDWDNLFEELQKLPKRAHVKIAKKHLNANPPWPTSKLGLPKKCIRQFRSDHPFKSIHVREYPEHYTAHIDLYSPRKNPFRHWVFDTPEYLVFWSIVSTAIVFFGTKLI